MSSHFRPGSFTRLGEVLAARSEEIVEQWRVRVDATVRNHGLTSAELTDHMPQFLAELTSAALAIPEDAPPAAAAWHEGATGWPSPEHGRQRLRDGFDVDEVVREYGILGDVVLATCADAGFVPSVAEARLLNASLVRGAGAAIAAYVKRRDTEMERLASRHLAFIAHEVRNPLGTAWIAVDLLADRATDDMKSALDILRRSLTRLQKEIDTVLVEPPLPFVERVPVAVAEILRQVCEDVLPEARLKSIGITCDAGDAVEVAGDARTLASAFGNVIRNAVKFSAPGSEVGIQLRVHAAEVRVDVEDRCGGLPRGHESMFRPGVRMHRQQDGYGLGLAIAKQAIDAHGGWIDVRDRPGVGCVMQIGLPVDAPS